MPGLVPGIHVLHGAAALKTWMAGASPAMTNSALLTALLLHLAGGRLGREPAAAAREGVFSALRPGAVDGTAGKHVPGRVPVAERVAVPGRARRESRQAELVPDDARLLHVVARRQRERRHRAFRGGVDHQRGVALAAAGLRAVAAGTM